MEQIILFLRNAILIKVNCLKYLYRLSSRYAFHLLNNKVIFHIASDIMIIIRPIKISSDSVATNSLLCMRSLHEVQEKTAYRAACV